MNEHEKINYVEFPCADLSKTKQFFTAVFGWQFEDFGPEYTAFSNQGLEGGFFHSPLASQTRNGAALIVFFSSDLEATMAKVEQYHGKIVKEIFSFPGGRRFHFCEPCGNELAVWSDS